MHGMYWSVMFGWVPVSLIPSPNLAAAWRYHIWPFYKSNSVHIASGCITCVRLLCLSTLHCVTLHYIQNTHGTHGEYNLTYLNPSGGSIITLHDIALDCSITLYYIYTLHCVALHYIYIHYMTLRDVTLRCVTLHYIHNTHDTHGDVICYVCVRGRATAVQQRGPKTSSTWKSWRLYRLRPPIHCKSNSTPARKLIPFPVYQAPRHPLRLLQEYQVGSCLVQFLNDEVAPASPVLDESHFPCGKKTGIFGHTNCHFNRENIGKIWFVWI